MKRSKSSYVIDGIVLEPLVASFFGGSLLLFPGLMRVFTPWLVDFAVFMVVGTVATLIIQFGLWVYVFIQLPRLEMKAGEKAGWAIALLLLAPLTTPTFFWRFLRHEFLPDAPSEQA